MLGIGVLCDFLLLGKSISNNFFAIDNLDFNISKKLKIHPIYKNIKKLFIVLIII